MVSAAGWWNPVTWLQNVAGFFHGAYDAGGAVLNVLGGALTILTQFFRFFFDTGHFIADAVNWLTSALFPPELQTWFLGTIGAPGQQWNSAQIYESLYQGMMAPALMIAGVAAASRIIRALVDHRTGSMETILSVLPRFLLAVAVIGVPGTPVSLGYTAIVWCIDASIAVSGAVVGLILHASLLNGFQPGQGWFTHLYGVLTASSNEMVAVVVGGIPLLILLLYAGFSDDRADRDARLRGGRGAPLSRHRSVRHQQSILSLVARSVWQCLTHAAGARHGDRIELDARIPRRRRFRCRPTACRRDFVRWPLVRRENGASTHVAWLQSWQCAGRFRGRGRHDGCASAPLVVRRLHGRSTWR